jgi:hypothetical protein
MTAKTIMSFRPLLLLAAFPLWTVGAEFALLNKTKITCDTLVMAKETPSVFITAKDASGNHTYRYSEVDLATVPEDLRTSFETYRKEQLQKRLILKDDKWISRDAMLLKEDPKYGYKRNLAKVGESILEFVNETDGTVTLGIRSGDRGYEMHVEAGKHKSYQVPNGTVRYIMAQESKDGKALIIQQSADQPMTNLRLTVTIVTSDKIPEKELGLIPIPAEYQVPTEK